MNGNGGRERSDGSCDGTGSGGRGYAGGRGHRNLSSENLGHGAQGANNLTDI